jgi:phosphoribosylformimino-5-aminoimidazole carboxamide ribotide isomerase
VRVDGDPVVLAGAYLTGFGLAELYVADLDGIVRGRPQESVVRALVALGAPVWLDAGVSSVEAAETAIELGAARVIVGLETLSSFDALGSICRAIGSDRVAFSLDLRAGVAVTANAAMAAGGSPAVLAARAADAGARAITLIDLARVGSGQGIDVEMVERVRRATPGVILLAGGGIRTRHDIDRLEAAGCDGILLATALHDGSIGAADLAPYGRDKGR